MKGWLPRSGSSRENGDRNYRVEARQCPVVTGSTEGLVTHEKYVCCVAVLRKRMLIHVCRRAGTINRNIG